MKKPCLNQLIVAGMTTGLLINSLSILAEDQATNKPKSDFLSKIAELDGNITYHLMTEDELMLQLNQDGANLYQSLSPEGKALALRTASRACNGTNECAGLNACRTQDNKCAGFGKCKGLSKCAISDPNVAVRLAAKKMAEKRENIQNQKD